MRAFSIFTLLTLSAALAAGQSTLEPKDVAARLTASKANSKPLVLQVGVAYQYRADHIPGAIYAGPAGRPAGLDVLKAALEKLPRDREIVLYCGCCPWDKCPNIRPAVELLKTMGFTHVSALHIADTFKADWIDKGFPVEHGDTADAGPGK